MYAGPTNEHLPLKRNLRDSFMARLGNLLADTIFCILRRGCKATLLARVLYVAKFAEGIYVLHAFEKRTRRTRQADIDLARKRLRELNRWRKQHR